MSLEPPPKIIRSPLWPGVQAVGPFCAVEGADLILDEAYRQPRDGQMGMMLEHIFESPRRVAEYLARMQHELQLLGALGEVQYGRMDLDTQRAIDALIAKRDPNAEYFREFTADVVPPPLGAPVTWEHLVISRNERDRRRVAAYFGEIDLRYIAALRSPRIGTPQPPRTTVGAQVVRQPVPETSMQSNPPGTGVYNDLKDPRNIDRVIRVMQSQLVDMGRLRGSYAQGVIDQATANALAEFWPVDYVHRHWQGFTLGWPDFAAALGDRPVTLEMLTSDVARLRDISPMKDPKRDYLLGGFADMVDQTFRTLHQLAAASGAHAGPGVPFNVNLGTVAGRGAGARGGAGAVRVRRPTSRIATMAKEVALAVAASVAREKAAPGTPGEPKDAPGDSEEFDESSAYGQESDE